MDLHKVAQTYVQRMVQETGDKPRILLLDEDTTGIVSLCTTQTSLLKSDVFLVDRLENGGRQKMRHLDCICVLRPTNAVITALLDELRNPRYASYTLYFTNVLKKSHLERLAESDDHETVKRIVEMYCDTYIINRDFFSLNVPQIYGSESNLWNSTALDRCKDGLIATLLSLKVNPLIRYEANSPLAQKLAQSVTRSIEQQGQLFDFRNQGSASPILMILSRENDPVTPLLSHWTYQAMVDELIGIKNNRIDLENQPDVPDELKEAVLAQDQDQFFSEAMYLNFGDLGTRIRDYVGHYQTKTKSNANIETVADMKRFVEEFPEFRKLGSNVSKHVGLVGELSRQVESFKALDVSEIEQSLACSDNHNNDLKSIQQIISDPSISLTTKYRLIALYALHFENHSNNQVSMLLELVERTSGGSSKLKRAIETLPVFSSDHTRQEDIFGTSSFLGRAQKGLKGLKGVENVYTQHRPLLLYALENIAKGKLRKQKYPFYDNDRVPASIKAEEDTPVPSQVVVFMIGGATYEEARIVAEFNQTSQTKVILGGTSTINGTQFLNTLGSVDWPLNNTERLRRRG